jgi:putative transcriptional regulator
VETQRGFVLHSSDFFIEDSTLPIDDGICLTATLDILKAIARGNGPQSAVLALGYAGWAPGQLESEIQENGWLHCPADPDLIFGSDTEAKYARALRKIGIDPGMLSSEAGHA